MGKLSRVKGVIEAFHGSPHDFDSFDMSKIGTGEGAQAYGHGLYFADSEDVARSYRDVLSKSGTDGAQRRLQQTGGDIDAAILKAKEKAARYRAGGADGYASAVEEDLRFLEKFKETGEWSDGRMYEVNINANPDDFLDWDKPFRDQPPAVQKAIDDVMELQGVKSYIAPDGQKVYVNTGVTSDTLGMDLLGLLGSDRQQSSKELLARGVPGIRYKDQFSRVNSGVGTSNYVIFDDKLISIAKKYGIALPVAGTALQAEQAKAAVMQAASNDFAQRRQAKQGRFKALKDTILEGMAAVNRGVVDTVNFLGPDQVNAVLQMSGSERRVPDLYDIPGVKEGTAKEAAYMEPGAPQQIIRTAGEFLSPL